MPSEETKEAKPTPVVGEKSLSKKFPLRYVQIGGIALAIILLAGAAWLFSGAFSKANDQQEHIVVVLDAPLLTMQQLKSAQDDLADAEEASKLAEDFSHRLTQILDEYRAAGILVINKSAALAVPRMSDITPLVAERLGLELELDDDGQ